LQHPDFEFRSYWTEKPGSQPLKAAIEKLLSRDWLILTTAHFVDGLEGGPIIDAIEKRLMGITLGAFLPQGPNNSRVDLRSHYFYGVHFGIGLHAILAQLGEEALNYFQCP
jgi:hypothetical protein